MVGVKSTQNQYSSANLSKLRLSLSRVSSVTTKLLKTIFGYGKKQRFKFRQVFLQCPRFGVHLRY